MARAYPDQALGDSFLPASLEVLTLEGTRVREVTAFVWPELFGRFGLPAELPAGR